MRLIDFGPAKGREIDAFGSRGVTLAPLTEPLTPGSGGDREPRRIAEAVVWR
jgi:hypothetical protein